MKLMDDVQIENITDMVRNVLRALAGLDLLKADTKDSEFEVICYSVKDLVEIEVDNIKGYRLKDIIRIDIKPRK